LFRKRGSSSIIDGNAAYFIALMPSENVDHYRSLSVGNIAAGEIF